MADGTRITRSPAGERGFAGLGDVEVSNLRLRPVGFVRGRAADLMTAAGTARWIAGGPVAFTHIQLLERDRPPVVLALTSLDASFSRWPQWRNSAISVLETIARPRPPWAGLSLDRPRIMGVVNVTPDSFSDGGRFFDTARAIEHGRALLAAGADVVDVGGESTRPGAERITVEEELRRVLPVVRALAEAGATISIDTRRAQVMAAARDAGARVVNDVTALAGDPASLAMIARSDMAVVLMHMQGEPATMQCEPRYDDVVLEVSEFLEARIARCESAGIARSRLLVDPGIGFGKTLTHNLELLAHLSVFHALGAGLLVGVSRKSFIAQASREEPPDNRLGGSLAAGLAACAQGAHWLRTHDVAESRQALAIRRQIDSVA